MFINSSLVSAQNRQRFYAFNWKVEQPENRGIVLKDVLETGEPYGETDGKSYALTATYYKCQPAEKVLIKRQRTMVANPVGVGYRNRRENDGKLYRRFETHNEEKSNALTTVQTDSMVAEPINITIDGKSQTLKAQYYKNSIANFCCYTSTYGATGVAEPTRNDETNSGSIYRVENGHITIKEKQYPIKLPDGIYNIRKLTPTECERLQTMPDGYTCVDGVSNTQRYKALGNGWTAEVIIHILNGALKDVPKDYPIEVLSMYDGIGTGRYCLEKMGFTNITYKAYEIDKYAIKIATANYPDIIECGDAFTVRDDDWKF